MRCTSPRTVGFYSDGKTLCWSPKHYSKEYPTFPLPCGKCISCRLEYSRQWAVRCIHEAQMHENNSFITLTYDDEHLDSQKLQYEHFQKFIKDLRNEIHATTLEKIFPGQPQSVQRKAFRTLGTKDEIIDRDRISVFVTGEYGDLRKRPHWHALIFNWRPTDLTHKYTNERGDKVYTSEILSKLWPNGISELGQVTFESAGYCARYAAKKLVHGKDGTHDFNPISKKSARNAIGKSFLEKFHEDIFNSGFCLIEKDGEKIKSGIPRYYEKWLQKHHPEKWKRYVTQKKLDTIELFREREENEIQEDFKTNNRRQDEMGLNYVPQISRIKTKETILNKKFHQLMEFLKL